jgi:hypothetical protein
MYFNDPQPSKIAAKMNKSGVIAPEGQVWRDSAPTS